MAIGCANRSNEKRNPFSGAERARMLKAYLEEEGFAGKVRVIDVNAAKSQKDAVSNMFMKCGKVDVIFFTKGNEKLARMAAMGDADTSRQVQKKGIWPVCDKAARRDSGRERVEAHDWQVCGKVHRQWRSRAHKSKLCKVAFFLAERAIYLDELMMFDINGRDRYRQESWCVFIRLPVHKASARIPQQWHISHLCFGLCFPDQVERELLLH